MDMHRTYSLSSFRHWKKFPGWVTKYDDSDQGWAILDDFIAIPILGGQNCRELVKSKAPENFIGKNWSNIEKPKKELVNLEKMAIAIKEQFFIVHCIYLLSHLKTLPQPFRSCIQSFRIL